MLRVFGLNSRPTKSPTEPTFGRCSTGTSREKTLALREETFAKEVASLAAQGAKFESRCQGLEVRNLELDKLSGSRHQWRQELQEAASKQAVAEMELEEDRKSLAKRESHATNMERQLERQFDALKSLKESAAKKKAELEERTCETEAAKAALDTRVQEVVQEAVRKLQKDQRQGAQRIVDWASEASSALVPLGMSLIQVAGLPASIADAPQC
jgi:hypothetical protein